MKSRILLALVAVLPMMGAVDGVVVNKSTGKPQEAATVSLYKFGEAGMESLETVKSDAAGKFAFTVATAGGPHLIQAAYDGVTYNKMLSPGAPTTGVEVEVFNSQGKPGDAQITQHMILFEPNEGTLLVNENIIFQNTGKFTYNDPDNGTFRFYLPAAAQGNVRIMASAPNGMPIERASKPTRTENVQAVDFPIKPGETRFQLTYQLPMPDPPIYTARIMHKEGTTRLVTPRGVSLKADNIVELGREPATQAAIYDVKGQELKLEISGTGSLREAAGGGEGGEEEGPGIQEILPRIYDRLYWVFGLAGGILLIGFLMLYRAPVTAPAGPAGAAASTAKGKGRG